MKVPNCLEISKVAAKADSRLLFQKVTNGVSYLKYCSTECRGHVGLRRYRNHPPGVRLEIKLDAVFLVDLVHLWSIESVAQIRCCPRVKGATTEMV